MSLPSNILWAGQDAGGDGGTGGDAGVDAGQPNDAGPMDAGGLDAGVDAGGCPNTLTTLSHVCNDAGWCWERPLPHGNPINGMWATAANDVWAVAAAGLITHWDGTSWSAVPSPTDKDLVGLWGDGASEVWAVGNAGTVLRWDCTGWSQLPYPGSFSKGIWGTGPEDLWVVGGAGASHWDGGAWTQVLDSGAFSGVWGDAPDDYWFVGAGSTVTHYVGNGQFVTENVPDASFLNAVFGADGGVWAAGTGNVYYRPADGGWRVALTCALSDFEAVWGTSDQDVWAVDSSQVWHGGAGAAFTNCAAAPVGGWRSGMLPSPLPNMTMKSGASAGGTVWVGGFGGTIVSSTNAGASWQVVVGGRDETLASAWTDGTSAFAGGGTSNPDGGLFLARAPSGAWSVDPVDAGVGPGVVQALQGTSTNDLWAGDSTGRIWSRTNGWTAQPVSFGLPSCRAMGETPNQRWMVGEPGPGLAVASGAVATGLAPGTTWVDSFSGEPALFAAWPPAGGETVWTVGDGGVFISFDLTSLTPLPYPLPSAATVDLYGLWADDTGTFWAVGASGALCSGTDAGLLSCVQCPGNVVCDAGWPATPQALRAVWGASGGDIWAVGDNGYAGHYGVGVWSFESLGTGNDLTALAGSDGGGVWVVGQYGTILHKP